MVGVGLRPFSVTFVLSYLLRPDDFDVLRWFRFGLDYKLVLLGLRQPASRTEQLRIHSREE